MQPREITGAGLSAHLDRIKLTGFLANTAADAAGGIDHMGFLFLTADAVVRALSGAAGAARARFGVNGIGDQ